MSVPAEAWRLGGRPCSPFRVCGLVGLGAATGVALGLAAAGGASLGLEAAVIALAVLTFLALALATKAATGAERLIYYHHEVAVLTVTAGAVALAGGDVRAHFDATAVGLGAFLACGRVGCLTVGCCHGRPARHGISYPRGHAIVPAYFAGRPLLPVQAIEAAAVACLVAAGGALVLSGAPAGTAGALYVTGYAVVRFGLEAVRGDPARRSWRSITEAQWTSVGLAAVIAGLSRAGQLPGAGWHVAPAALLAALATAVAVCAPPPRGLLDPRHVAELRRALVPTPPGRPIVVRRTSLGVALSAGPVAGGVHYAFSGTPDPATAAELAGAVLWLEHASGGFELRPGAAGVWHLLAGGG